MASLGHFLELFDIFRQGLPEGYQYCIEIRNPNFLENEYFDFLAEHHLGHVFLQGYYMPSIFDQYEKFKDRLSDPVVLRLHGLDRPGIDERTNNVWDKIVKPKDDELLQLKCMVNDLLERRHQVFINVNIQTPDLTITLELVSYHGIQTLIQFLSQNKRQEITLGTKLILLRHL